MAVTILTSSKAGAFAPMAMRMRKGAALVLMAFFLAIAPRDGLALASEPRATAIFPVELWDTSGEGTKTGQGNRLKLATNRLTELLEHTGRYRSVDLSRFTARVAAT